MIPGVCAATVALLLLPTMGAGGAIAGGAWAMFVGWLVQEAFRACR